MAGPRVVDEPLTAHTYTRSRRYPKVFGRMPGRDGAYLPGGPYTMTQAVVFLALVLLVWKVPLFGAVFGPARWLVPLAAVFLRRARIESRAPLGWLAGLATHLVTSGTGTVAGSTYCPPTPQWMTTQIHLHPTTSNHTPEGVPDCAADSVGGIDPTAMAQQPRSASTPVSVLDLVDEPVTPPSPAQRPVPRARPARPTRPAPAVASPLQQLLARTGTGTGTGTATAARQPAARMPAAGSPAGTPSGVPTGTVTEEVA